MARATFGGTAVDFLYDRGPANVLQSVTGTVTFWTAAEEGAQLTDLLLNGVPVTHVPVNAQGQLPAFRGPDGVVDMWADAGAGWRVRIASDPVAAAARAEAAAERAESLADIETPTELVEEIVASATIDGGTP